MEKEEEEARAKEAAKSAVDEEENVC